MNTQTTRSCVKFTPTFFPKKRNSLKRAKNPYLVPKYPHFMQIWSTTPDLHKITVGKMIFFPTVIFFTVHAVISSKAQGFSG